jgi:hypothetical protein
MHPRLQLLRVVPAALVAAVLAFGAAVALPVPAANAAEVTWGVRTGGTDQGIDRQNYDYAIDPGTTVEDTLVVSNYDDAPLQLSVYAADGFTTEAGQLDVQTPDIEPAAVGTWVTFGADSVEVPAGQSVEIPFTLAIPADATPGDYAGGLITSLAQPEQEQGITVDRRLGIRMHVRVGGELQPTIAIENMKVDYAGTLNPFAPGDATVSYVVHNTGNAILSAGQSIAVTGPFGMLPVSAAGIERVPELLPGEDWAVTVPLSGVAPSFLLTATAVVLPELPDDDSSTNPVLSDVQATATTWAVPWMLLLLILLIAAAVVAAILVSRRRRRTGKAAEEARVQAAVEAALRERGEAQ